jgi:acetyl-CoA acyltransferase
MAEAWVIEAVRTPFGRRGGSLAGYHPIDLLALALDAVVARAGVAAGEVTAVVAGCGAQVGAQAGNIARRAVLAAGWPERNPGTTVESHAASSAEAVISAYQSTLVDPDALVVACGVDVMSTVPLGANLAVPSVGKPFGRGLADRYPPGTGYLTPGQAAEEAAERWSLGRSDLDRWALLSGERARKARGRRDLVPVALKGVRAPLRADEGLSPARTAR